MDSSMLSAADIAAVTRGNYGCGDGWGLGNGGLISLLVLFALFGSGGFGWGNRGFDGRCATVEDLNNSANASRIESQIQGIGTNQLTQFNNITNAVSTLGYETLKNFNDLATQLAECCCATQRAIDSVKFDMANYASSINANVTAQVQSVKDMISQDKIASLQNQVNQMYLSSQLCGIVRYPTAATFNAGYFPFAYNNGCGCGCANI